MSDDSKWSDRHTVEELADWLDDRSMQVARASGDYDEAARLTAAADALRELNEKAGARADYRFERSLCEALNSGNGSYKP